MERKPCPICNKPISLSSLLCLSCLARQQWGNPIQRQKKIAGMKAAHPPIPRPQCLDCGKTIKSRYAMRCPSCSAIYNSSQRNPKRAPHTETTKAKIRQRTLAKMQDPVWRQQWQKAIRERSDNPLWKEKQKIGSIRRSDTTSWKEKNALMVSRVTKSPKWIASMQNNPCWQRGKAHPSWQGGQNKRLGIAYKKWRTKIFRRDNYTCQQCNTQGGRLHAHHLQPFASEPTKRLQLDNGITLCVKCHRYIHNHFIPD